MNSLTSTYVCRDLLQFRHLVRLISGIKVKYLDRAAEDRTTEILTDGVTYHEPVPRSG